MKVLPENIKSMNPMEKYPHISISLGTCSTPKLSK